MKNDKLQELKQLNLKVASLIEELEQSLLIEKYKAEFPETKLCVFKKEFQDTKYEIKFIKLLDNFILTEYLGNIAFLKYWFGENSLYFKNYKIKNGSPTKYELKELEKMKIISVEKLK